MGYYALSISLLCSEMTDLELTCECACAPIEHAQADPSHAIGSVLAHAAACSSMRTVRSRIPAGSCCCCSRMRRRSAPHAQLGKRLASGADERGVCWTPSPPRPRPSLTPPGCWGAVGAPRSCTARPCCPCSARAHREHEARHGRGRRRGGGGGSDHQVRPPVPANRLRARLMHPSHGNRVITGPGGAAPRAPPRLPCPLGAAAAAAHTRVCGAGGAAYSPSTAPSSWCCSQPSTSRPWASGPRSTAPSGGYTAS